MHSWRYVNSANTPSGLNRVHSLDQLNQVSFEGFGSEGLKASLAVGKYNTLPVSSVSVIRDGFRFIVELFEIFYQKYNGYHISSQEI